MTTLLALWCCRCAPYYDGEAETLAPEFIVATVRGPGPDASVPVVLLSDDLSACAVGRGTATIIAPEVLGSRQGSRTQALPCESLRVLDAPAIRSLLDNRGYRSGAGPLPRSARPLVSSSSLFGYEVVVWSVLEDYYVRYNDTDIRLVQWSHGNRWGNESAHGYTVTLGGAVPVIDTTSSQRRAVALEVFPDF